MMCQTQHINQCLIITVNFINSSTTCIKVTPDNGAEEPTHAGILTRCGAVNNSTWSLNAFIYSTVIKVLGESQTNPSA